MVDFDGEARPFDFVPEPRGDGSNIDIGADEYVLGGDMPMWITR